MLLIVLHTKDLLFKRPHSQQILGQEHFYSYHYTNPSNMFFGDSKTSQVFPSYLFATTAATSFTWLKNNQCKRYGFFFHKSILSVFQNDGVKLSTTEFCLKLSRNLILLTKCSFCWIDQQVGKYQRTSTIADSTLLE